MPFDNLPPDNNEDTEHTPAERAAAASRSTWVSVGVNLVLTVLQIVVGVLAKSQGLVADGVHSLSDLGKRGLKALYPDG
jgi:divalent metal cation (Fe/Co/Zn/Cd) transporter